MELSILTFQSTELDLSYLEAYLGALREWNTLEGAELVVISQMKDNRDLVKLCNLQPFPVRVVTPAQDWAGDCPIWDIMKSIRLVWPYLTGNYITCNHPEYIWGPDRLQRTIGWLRRNKPYFAMGNLRRPGSREAVSAQRTADHGIRDISEAFFDLLKTGNWNEGVKIFEEMETANWMFWHPEQKPGVAPHVEDVFFADRAWLFAWKWADHVRDLPFQDVYDLNTVAIQQIFHRFGARLRCIRMPQTVNRIIHLWHHKQWITWTPEVRDWFLSQPAKWAGTRFLNAEAWDALLEERRDPTKGMKSIVDMRQGAGGTVYRYREALAIWLKNGGFNALKNFYRDNGRYGRTEHMNQVDTSSVVFAEA